MSNPNRPFGWRKRIGLLSPTVIETAAYDFYRLAPDGVSMCATTSNIDHWSRENFQQHVLDPIVSLRQRIRLPPGAAVRLCFATGMASDRDTAEALAWAAQNRAELRRRWQQYSEEET